MLKSTWTVCFVTVITALALSSDASANSRSADIKGAATWITCTEVEFSRAAKDKPEVHLKFARGNLNKAYVYINDARSNGYAGIASYTAKADALSARLTALGY